jgi:hypothetical protein
VTLIFLPAPGHAEGREAVFRFEHVVACLFENEMGARPLCPVDLPMTAAGTGLPSLRVEGSDCFETYRTAGHADPARHAQFLFVSHDIVLHLMGDPEPAADWIA